jgi:low affinity Fe/Cu permease
MTTEQMNEMTTEQEKSQQEASRHLEAIYWGGVIIWAGLIFGADSLGYLPQIGGADAWSWVFLGAGLYALLLALFRLNSLDYSNPTTWDYVWAGILMILGLGGFFSFNIAWPLILVLVGIAILGKTVLRRQ